MTNGVIRDFKTIATQRNIPEDAILHMSDSSPIQNGLKQGAALTLLLGCHYERPGKPGGTEIDWNTSALGLC
jgi:hypothetical protein